MHENDDSIEEVETVIGQAQRSRKRKDKTEDMGAYEVKQWLDRVRTLYEGDNTSVEGAGHWVAIAWT